MDPITRLSLTKTKEQTGYQELSSALAQLPLEEESWLHINSAYSYDLLQTLFSFFHLDLAWVPHLLSPHLRTEIFQDQQMVLLSFYAESHQRVCILLMPHTLITISETVFPAIEALKNEIKPVKSNVKEYILCSVINTVLETFFVAFEKLDDTLEALERRATSTHSATESMQRIQQIHRKLLTLKKAIWPIRDVLTTFLHMEAPTLKKSTYFFFHMTYDRSIQAVETLEGLRDIAAGLLDLYISAVNYHTNEIIKFLTIVSTLFVPATFIVSVYGMNFKNMPELDSPWGYPMVMLIIILFSGIMLLFFRRKRWI